MRWGCAIEVHKAWDAITLPRFDARPPLNTYTELSAAILKSSVAAFRLIGPIDGLLAFTSVIILSPLII